MKILITGGGTGGHIYPAIAIANKIKDEIKNAEILFVGTEKGLESKLVPNAGFRLSTITVSGFRRSLSLDTIKSMRDLLYGIKDATKILKDFKPDLVIGTGGYVCGPIVFMASLLNIKTIIHEQNVIPGVTNKILGKFVNKILISFEESEKYFNNRDKTILTGNPVRKNFVDVDKKEYRKALGFEEDRLVIMSFGGSRGAEKINKTMVEVIKEYNGSKDIAIIHVTGDAHYESVLKDMKERNIKIEDNILIKEYIHDMARYMAASDLVICRSGAITLAEITTMGLPSVLIPSPNVTNNHQEFNARVLEKKGAAMVVLEKDLSGKIMVDLLNKMIKNRNRLATMGEKSKELSKPNATDMIYTNILNLLKS